MERFSNESIKFDVLKERAYNNRWAEVEDGVIPLTAADPDFPVAPEIINAMVNYLQAGHLSYIPKLGLPKFRESIANVCNERKHEGVKAEFVLPIDSAARGLQIIAQTVLKPGDEAIIFDPCDYLLKESTVLAGGVPVLFPARIKDGKIDLSTLESYITPKTKMIGLCNPHNPLGMLYPKEDLELILNLAEKYDLWIMNDEIWSDIVYSEKEFLSILSFGEKRNQKTITTFGFSKSFGVAGLRIGCLYCTTQKTFDDLVKNSQVMSTVGGLSSISQIAGIACIDEAYYWVDEFLVHLEKNRDYALERIAKMPYLTCQKPEATYLLFPDITATGMTSTEFSDLLLKEEKLAIVPGVDKFFGPGAEGHIRICFATSHEVLAEGLNRLEKGLKMVEKNKK